MIFPVALLLLLEAVFKLTELSQSIADSYFQCVIYLTLWFVCDAGGNYKGHVDVLAPTVQELAALEKEAQTSFLHLGYLPNQLFRTFWFNTGRLRSE